ncbi:MAG: hypothetical protein GC150_14870 [Rhizobiales bacterium]|nr:hypothetical protein [Hyphomicrobiales bacterium]
MTAKNGRTVLRSAALGLAAVAATIMGGLSAEAASFADLSGSWNGRGWITLNNGGRERVQCRVVYEAQGTNRIVQNLRCASTSYKIDATSHVQRSGNALYGTWTEKSFDVEGSLSGEALDDGFSLSLSGNVFNAGMSVRLDGGCRHDLNINVHGIDIRNVSMGLRKC